MEFTKTDCDEILVFHRGSRYFWIPETGTLRAWGNSKPFLVCRSRREVVAAVLARST